MVANRLARGGISSDWCSVVVEELEEMFSPPQRQLLAHDDDIAISIQQGFADLRFLAACFLHQLEQLS